MQTSPPLAPPCMYIGVVGESPGRRGTATSTNSPVIGNSRKGPKPVRAWLATGVYGTSPARSVYTLQAEATSWACGVSAMVSDGFGGDAGFLGGSWTRRTMALAVRVSLYLLSSTCCVQMLLKSAPLFPAYSFRPESALSRCCPPP